MIVAPAVGIYFLKTKHQIELLAEELKIAKENAEAATLARDNFIANMSHEMRTPLTHIIGFTELLLMDEAGRLTVKQKEYIDYIMNSSKILLNSVFLDLVFCIRSCQIYCYTSP